MTIRKFILGLIAAVLALSAIPDSALAQCNGQFGANQVCGSVAGGFPGPTNFSSFSGGATGNVTWINVKQAPCNAVGNGVADDTAAINTCIANLNSAGKGVLYFPAGTYLTSSALTTITASSIVRGDGATNLIGSPTNPPTPLSTVIESNSATANLLTFNTASANTVEDISFYNIAATPSGSGITQISPTSAGKLIINRVHVRGFNVGIDLQEAASGVTVANTIVWDSVLYGIRVRNLQNADDGGWIIKSSGIYQITRNATSGIRWDGTGGAGSINDVHVVGNSSSSTFTNGMDFQASGLTVDMGIVNDSIENIATNFININGSIPNVWIVAVEFGGFNNCVSCIGINVNGTSQLTIANVIFTTANFAPPIKLVSCTQCFVTNVVQPAGTAGGVYGAGGTPADHDGTGGIGGSAYFASSLSGTTQRLTWTGPTGNNSGAEVHVALDPTATNAAANFVAINDTGLSAQFGISGSTNGTLANAGGLFANKSIAMIADSSTLTGGADDIVMYVGFNQELFRVQHNGHLNALGQNLTAPSLTAGCNGAGSSVAGTDVAGTVTGQTAVATTCTLTFGNAYAAAPFCTATGNSSPLTGAVTPSTTTLVVNFASTANYKWSYICFGK